MVKTKKINLRKKFSDLEDRSSFPIIGYVIIALLAWVLAVRLIADHKMDEIRGYSEGEDTQIRYKIHMDKHNYKPGESVTIYFSIKNISDEDVTLFFEKDLEFDVVVYDVQDYLIADIPQAIWKYSSTNFIPKNQNHQVMLQPQEKREYSAVWGQVDFEQQQVEQGSYTITAHSLARNRSGFRVVTSGSL